MQTIKLQPSFRKIANKNNKQDEGGDNQDGRGGAGRGGRQNMLVLLGKLIWASVFYRAESGGESIKKNSTI